MACHVPRQNGKFQATLSIIASTHYTLYIAPKSIQLDKIHNIVSHYYYYYYYYYYTVRPYKLLQGHCTTHCRQSLIRERLQKKCLDYCRRNSAKKCTRIYIIIISRPKVYNYF